MPAITGDVTTTVGTVAATVVKINGTTLSGLATGILKNTTATGVPSIAVAGTDLIGGVGNLTTVGAVPYVSATGTLNQDAAELFWDATNDRLGIGTASPSYKLDVGGFAAAAATIRVASTGAISSIRLMEADDTFGFSLQNINGSRFGIFRHNASQPGAEVLSILRDTGKVGIGSTAPTAKLTVTGTSGVWIGDGVSSIFQVTTGTGINTDNKIEFGISDASHGYIQVSKPGTALYPLVLQPNGSNVGIGTTAPVYLLDVARSGASGTARFYDQTATTGATRVVISLGAADTSSTQVFEIGGLMKFSGLNSTGAGSALLGTNSPAVTNTAPYTWLKVLTSDGSTAYVPAWK
jgi:hypothetical protein